MKTSEKKYGKFALTKNLPSPPQVLLKLLDACGSGHATPKELSKIVFRDPSISTKILQLINSSFMGLREKVDNLEKAIIYLGSDTIKNVAISASVCQVFRRAKGSDQFNLHHFWWHSVMCGTLAKRIAKKTGYSSTDEAFLSGMLHDIGKLLLWENHPEQYAAALREAGSDTERLLSEEAQIGAAHHELGAWMVRQWRLSSLMADAIYYHHDPLERIVDAFPLVKIVFLANLLSRNGSEAKAGDVEIARSLFDLAPDQVRDILADAQNEVTDVAMSLEIPAAPPEPLKLSEAASSRDDEPHEEKLAVAVKHLSLMYGTLQNLLKADSREAILKTAANGFQILFGIQHFVLFLCDAESGCLRGYGASVGFGSGSEGDLILSTANGQSLLARCFIGGQRFDSFHPPDDRPLSIADEQILRLLGTEGMLCLPLIANRDPVGIIVAGVSTDQARGMADQHALLDLFIGHSAMCLYVNEIKQSQTRLLQTERLEASTTMAGKVVHEVNNPLGIIKNYLKILGLKLPEKHPAQAELAVISEEIDRVGQIVRGLKDFASPAGAVLEQVDINLLLKNILAIVDSSTLKPSMIQLHFSPDPAVPAIRTERNGLKQIVLNLVKNAAEAMPKGGNIHVTTRRHSAPEPISKGGTKPFEKVDILIKDDGPGIPEEIKRHLFEPFHSTKKKGHSGLGLSIVRSIVKKLNGSITCETSPHAGTAYKLTLPVASEEPAKSLGE